MKYCIVHVNDRAIDKISYNKNILESFQYVDEIEFFNGNVGNGWDVLNHEGINMDAWSPYDGRTFPPLPGEYGIWVSTVRIWQYIVNNKIDKMLVLEDDVVLSKSFVFNLEKCIQDLPESFDFLSLYYFLEHNQSDDRVDILSDNIQKSYNQFSGAQAILYSYHGAKKLLRLLMRKGLEYTPDCFVFRQSLEGLVDGYSIKGPNDLFLTHTYKEVKSLIDPENMRNTENL